MFTLIACCIAGTSTIGFVAIWFITSNRELAHAKQSVGHAAAQVRLHSGLYPQVRDGPYEAAAAGSLDTCRMIYRETVKNYEHIRRKPMNRFPAFVLGFHLIAEEEL